MPFLASHETSYLSAKSRLASRAVLHSVGSSAVHRHAAGNADSLSLDEGCVVTGQEGGNRGDVGGFTDAAKRRSPDDRLHPLFRTLWGRIGQGMKKWGVD